MRQLINLFKKMLLAATIVSLLSGFSFFENRPASADKTFRLNQFDLLSETSGWILLNQQLFWTNDVGRNWEDISPPGLSNGHIMAVRFIDLATGWVLWDSQDANGYIHYYLAATPNQGKTWNTRILALFELGDIAAYSIKAEMDWLDARNGWIAFKQPSGVNFSKGTLFTTTDGGETWEQADIPLAGNIIFTNPQQGWLVGGPDGKQVYTTQNSGQTWKGIGVPNLSSWARTTIYPPKFANEQGIMVTTSIDRGSELQIYATNNRAVTWQLLAQFPLDVEPGIIGISILDPKNLVAAIPGTNSIIQLNDRQLQVIENQDGLSASITELDMIDHNVGWGEWVDGGCSPEVQVCTSTTRLLYTQDGGANWQPVSFPLVQSDNLTMEFSTASEYLPAGSTTIPGNTDVFIGQGFDLCEIPTLSQLQTWWTDSPYKVVNLYIGGSSRACANSTLSASYLRRLYQQGWKFIPTWVGPQAPCTLFNSRMSSDVATAFSEGIDEANQAVNRLAELGLTYLDKTGSVVYYDIEYYGFDTVCRAAVNSFMDGWVSQLHALGNAAGVYGSTLCDTGLSDFLTIPNIPDAIWAARWYNNAGEGSYNPNASVWELGSCIPSTAWANHQRMRQYEGPHYETWGGLTLSIDNDVLDGIVAVPVIGPYVLGITRTGPELSSATNVDFEVTFSKDVVNVDIDNFRLTTTGNITTASVSAIAGSAAAYTITADTGAGNGTLRLDLIDDGTIEDLDGNKLGAPGSGDFTSGEVYTIIKEATFNDTPVSYWAWRAIESIHFAGITGGCSTTPPNYCPENPVTRGQMAVFLQRGLHGSSFSPPIVPITFTDTFTHWAKDWIEALKVDGITGGCGVNIYCPDNSVTRAQMAVFLLRSMHGASYAPPNPTGLFDDVPSTYWAAPWIEQLAIEGITSGCGDGNYCPENPVTRAQMAVFLQKTFNLP